MVAASRSAGGAATARCGNNDEERGADRSGEAGRERLVASVLPVRSVLALMVVRARLSGRRVAGAAAAAVVVVARAVSVGGRASNGS